MTDDQKKSVDQPNQNDDSESVESSDSEMTGGTTHDLRRHAEEALRLLREAQQKALMEAKAAEYDEKETAFDAAAPHATEKPPDIGNTTNDLAQAAMEAMRLAQEEQARKAAEAASQADSTAIFTDTTKLRIDVSESASPLVVDVVGEMVVGRGDNATDYRPEIDMTPYGAYRLGLSRRHAILKRDGDSLYLVDLGSRNGTLLNGQKLSPDEPQQLRDGDEIRLGNLTFQVAFQSD